MSRDNRRRPWHQRVVLKVMRNAPHKGIIDLSPLGLVFGINLLGCLIALLSRGMAVALVLAAGNLACLACHLRKPSNPLF